MYILYIYNLEYEFKTLHFAISATSIKTKVRHVVSNLSGISKCTPISITLSCILLSCKICQQCYNLHSRRQAKLHCAKLIFSLLSQLDSF